MIQLELIKIVNRKVFNQMHCLCVDYILNLVTIEVVKFIFPMNICWLFIQVFSFFNNNNQMTNIKLKLSLQKVISIKQCLL